MGLGCALKLGQEEERTETHTHREEGHVQREGETGVICQKARDAKQSREPGEAGKNLGRILP